MGALPGAIQGQELSAVRRVGLPRRKLYQGLWANRASPLLVRCENRDWNWLSDGSSSSWRWEPAQSSSPWGCREFQGGGMFTCEWWSSSVPLDALLHHPDPVHGRRRSGWRTRSEAACGGVDAHAPYQSVRQVRIFTRPFSSRPFMLSTSVLISGLSILGNVAWPGSMPTWW
jgi:hypothetical protein